MAGRSPDSVTRSLSACALRTQDARRPSSKTLKDFPIALSSTLMEQRGLSPQGHTCWLMQDVNQFKSLLQRVGKVRCPRGEARLTGAHLLQCKHLIHAVGPDYDTAVRCAGPAKATAEAHEKAKQLLADTYRNAFALANEASARSVALPAISCGVNGFGGYDSLDCAAKVSIQASLENDFILYDAICSEAWEEAADANESLQRDDGMQS
eukprot:s1139_g12.t2